KAVDVAAALAAFLYDRLEAAVDHALAVEWHRGELLLDRRIAQHLFVGCVARLPVRIFEPCENDLLVRLGVDCFAEVGDLAFRDVAVPGFDLPSNAEPQEDRSGLACVFAIGILVCLWHWRDESFEVGHAAAPSST